MKQLFALVRRLWTGLCEADARTAMRPVADIPRK
jgi:hypothetical protein